MTPSKIIEQLKAADQNKNGMFELGEDVMCALADLLEHRERDKQVLIDKTITPYFDTLALDTAREIMCDVNRRSELLGGDVQLLARIQCRIDEVCRTAMLKADEPTDDERILAIEGIIAGRDGNSPAVPDGWVMVPKEPTKEMTDAVLGRACFTRDGSGAKYIYQTMLAAAPKQESE